MSAATCFYQFVDGSYCPEPALPGEENEGKCLFHSRSRAKDRRQRLREALAAKTDGNYQGYVLPEGVDFSGKEIAQMLDFRNAIFPKGARANFRGATFLNGAWAYFREATFQEGAWADFAEATFQEGAAAEFRGATLQEGAEADFSGATFQEGAWADFTRATFRERAWADFTWATFQEGAWADFTWATFQKGAEADFTEATFHEGADASFTDATFQKGAWANFIGAMFHKGARANFAWATFQEKAGAYFAGATLAVLYLPRDRRFQGRAVFARTKFRQPVLFERCDFGKGSSFEDAELAPDSAFRFCDLSEVTFRGAAGLDRAEFDAVTWAPPPPPEGRWPRWWERWLGGHQRDALRDELAARKSGTKQDYEAAERIYRHLKKSYEARRDYPRAGDFHYGEMEMRRLAYTSRRQRWFFSLEALYWHLSGYGQQWRKALLWFGVLVLVFAFSHAWAGFQVLRPDPSVPGGLAPWHIKLELLGTVPWWEGKLGGIGESFLYSLRTATLLRDPAAAPLSLGGHALSTLESIFGPLLVGLMALAIRRRLQR